MPCTITQLRQEEYDDVEMQRYSDEQYEKLIEAAAALGPRHLVAVLLGGDAGLRLGEMVALEWTDIDLNTDTLNVRRQERRGKVGPTKGKKSRSLKMTPRLARALKALKVAPHVLLAAGGRWSAAPGHPEVGGPPVVRDDREVPPRHRRTEGQGDRPAGGA
jgi:integrase